MNQRYDITVKRLQANDFRIDVYDRRLDRWYLIPIAATDYSDAIKICDNVIDLIYK
jgi:hypothetical protein